ncbi:MAG: lipopolysaccharide biosynthesis protein [Solirubrobacteraceae bacterium]
MGALIARLPGLSETHANVVKSLGGSFGTQLALLISGVANARILGVLDRGRSALILLLATVLPMIGTLGMPLSVTYWIARQRSVGRALVRRMRRVIVAQIAAIFVLHAIVVAVVFWGAPRFVQVSALISLFGAPAILVWMYAMAILQGNQQFTALNLCRMFFPPINALVLFVFLVVGVKSLIVVTVTWVLLYGASAVITLSAARRGLRGAHDDPDVPEVAEMTRFGLKGMLGSVTPLEGFQLDQAIVGLVISQAALGIYVVAVAFTNLPRFISQSIGLVAYPNIASGADGRGYRRGIITFTLMTLALSGLTIIVTEVMLPFLVPVLFGSAFRPAIGVARILLISTLLFGLRRVLSECARGAGKPLIGSVAEAVCLVSLLPFVWLFSSRGSEGVALALVFVGIAGIATMVIGLWRGPNRRAPALPLEHDEALVPSPGS